MKNRQHRFRFKSLKLLLLISLSGCGYHAVDQQEKSTISIPYIRGDREGLLTDELTRQLAVSDLYDLVSSKGEYTLKVSIVGDQNDIVGFRYDRTEVSSRLERNLLATENRRILTAEIELIRDVSGETVIGPLTITANADYDYVDVSTLRELAFVSPSGKREKVIDFSLGQLDSVEGAQDAALSPVYSRIAEKIVAALQRASLKDFSDD